MKRSTYVLSFSNSITTFDLKQTKVKEEVNKTLDMTRSFKYQDKGKVQEICKTVSFPYPIVVPDS